MESGWQVGIWKPWACSDEERRTSKEEIEKALTDIGGSVDEIEWEDGEPMVIIASLPVDFAAAIRANGYGERITEDEIVVEVEYDR